MEQICSVCQNKYSKFRIPLKQECGDVLCLLCLVKIMEEGETYSCRVCQKVNRKIDVDNLGKKKKVIQNYDQECKTHDRPLEFFCQSHNKKICSVCILKKHRECKNIQELENCLESYDEIKKSKIKKLQEDYITLNNKIQNIENQINKENQRLSQHKAYVYEVAIFTINKLINNAINLYLDSHEKQKKIEQRLNEYKFKLQEIVFKINQLQEYSKIELEEIDDKIEVIHLSMRSCEDLEKIIPNFSSEDIQKKEILQIIMEQFLTSTD